MEEVRLAGKPEATDGLEDGTGGIVAGCWEVWTGREQAGVGEGGEWFVKLPIWAKHECKPSVDYSWKIVESAECNQPKTNGLELLLIWKNNDEWKCKHEGDHDHNCTCSVQCKFLPSF